LDSNCFANLDKNPEIIHCLGMEFVKMIMPLSGPDFEIWLKFVKFAEYFFNLSSSF